MKSCCRFGLGRLKENVSLLHKFQQVDMAGISGTSHPGSPRSPWNNILGTKTVVLIRTHCIHPMDSGAMICSQEDWDGWMEPKNSSTSKMKIALRNSHVMQGVLNDVCVCVFFCFCWGCTSWRKSNTTINDNKKHAGDSWHQTRKKERFLWSVFPCFPTNGDFNSYFFSRQQFRKLDSPAGYRVTWLHPWPATGCRCCCRTSGTKSKKGLVMMESFLVGYLFAEVTKGDHTRAVSEDITVLNVRSLFGRYGILRFFHCFSPEFHGQQFRKRHYKWNPISETP